MLHVVKLHYFPHLNDAIKNIVGTFFCHFNSFVKIFCQHDKITGHYFLALSKRSVRYNFFGAGNGFASRKQCLTANIPFSFSSFCTQSNHFCMCACCASGERWLGSPPRKINMYFSICHRFWLNIIYPMTNQCPADGQKFLKLFLTRRDRNLYRKVLTLFRPYIP